MSIEGDYYLEDIGYSSRLGKIIGYDLKPGSLSPSVRTLKKQQSL